MNQSADISIKRISITSFGSLLVSSRRNCVFVSTAIENISPGWRARETYRILNDNEFVETFALAEPNQDFTLYSETYFRRASR